MADPVPTWEDHIKHFFTQMDIGCMRTRIDLSDYQSVKDAVTSRILPQLKLRVTNPNAGMPKGGRAWPPDKIKKFEDWIAAGFPKGDPAAPTS